jgi:hypothetical protein
MSYYTVSHIDDQTLWIYKQGIINFQDRTNISSPRIWAHSSQDKSLSVSETEDWKLLNTQLYLIDVLEG